MFITLMPPSLVSHFLINVFAVSALFRVDYRLRYVI